MHGTKVQGQSVLEGSNHTPFTISDFIQGECAADHKPGNQSQVIVVIATGIGPHLAL